RDVGGLVVDHRLLKPWRSEPGALDVILAYLWVFCLSNTRCAAVGSCGCWVGGAGSGASGVCGGLVGWAGGDERWARGVGGPVAGRCAGAVPVVAAGSSG